MTGDPRPLMTEQARELAQRWAEKCRACQRDVDAPDADAECTDFLERKTEPLTDDERERLFAWVRARMAAEVKERSEERESLGCDEVDMPDNDMDTDALADAVGHDLGLARPGDYHTEDTPQRTLCGDAGWPS